MYALSWYCYGFKDVSKSINDRLLCSGSGAVACNMGLSD